MNASTFKKASVLAGVALAAIAGAATGGAPALGIGALAGILGWLGGVAGSQANDLLSESLQKPGPDADAVFRNHDIRALLRHAVRAVVSLWIGETHPNLAKQNREVSATDLEEAQLIAERGPMPLYLADVHLHRARLFGHLPADERAQKFPEISPKADLDEARRLIEEHGYERRKEELSDAEAAAMRW